MAEPRRLCERCSVNRAIRFFPPDRRRADGISTICRPCRKKKNQLGDRNTRLLTTYGITEAEYQVMFEQQGGRCAICRGARRQNLDVDHDHKTGLVRGLLCRRCNRRLLPAATDKPEVLQRAIDYLTDPPAPHALGGPRICPS